MSKLLYCIPSLATSGGTERILVEKINFLVENDFDVIVVTTEGINLPPFFNVSSKIKLIELNINFNDVVNKGLYEKYKITKLKLENYKKKLENIVTTEKVDICISTGAKEIEFLYRLKANCKKVCELHFSKKFRKQSYLSKNSNLIWRLIGNYRNKLFEKQTKYLDKLVVLTKEDQKEWNTTNSNIIQIYNFSAVDSETTADLDNKSVVAIGRLTEQKGFDRLIDIWALLAEKNIDWKLNIYGVGELEENLKKQVESLNLSNSIFFKGQTKNVGEKISKNSIFALTSRYEGFPLVLLESITCGVPIVSFDCKTGPNEIIINDDCGILVEDNNNQKFAEALDILISDSELRKIKGKSAKIISEKFSKKYIMRQWIDMFNELIKQ